MGRNRATARAATTGTTGRHYNTPVARRRGGIPPPVGHDIHRTGTPSGLLTCAPVTGSRHRFAEVPAAARTDDLIVRLALPGPRRFPTLPIARPPSVEGRRAIMERPGGRCDETIAVRFGRRTGPRPHFGFGRGGRPGGPAGEPGRDARPPRRPRTDAADRFGRAARRGPEDDAQGDRRRAGQEGHDPDTAGPHRPGARSAPWHRLRTGDRRSERRPADHRRTDV